MVVATSQWGKLRRIVHGQIGQKRSESTSKCGGGFNADLSQGRLNLFRHVRRNPFHPEVRMGLEEVLGALLVGALVCVHPGKDLADSLVVPLAGFQITAAS